MSRSMVKGTASSSKGQESQGRGGGWAREARQWLPLPTKHKSTHLPAEPAESSLALVTAGTGLCVGEQRDFLVFFSTRQVGKQQKQTTRFCKQLVGRAGRDVYKSTLVPWERSGGRANKDAGSLSALSGAGPGGRHPGEAESAHAEPHSLAAPAPPPLGSASALQRVSQHAAHTVMKEGMGRLQNLKESARRSTKT